MCEATIDPRLGTLVLFCPWIHGSFLTQKIYTVGLHLKGNKVPFEMMAQDYMGQMEQSLTKNNIMILNMAPAIYGDMKIYTTKIMFGFMFTKGTTPFLISPICLSNRFWTGVSNTKRAQRIEYRWLSKCQLCKSEGHKTLDCLWREVEQGGWKANFHHCINHKPGYIELDRKEKRMDKETSTKVMSLRPRMKKSRKGVKSSKKGKEKAMEVDM